jgi:phytoene desaturase
VNADFGAAMANLFAPGVIRKWSPANLRRKVYSCSTFMLYLGLDTRYDDAHHQILFAGDYHRNVEEIVRGEAPSEDMSIYVRNASITDSTLAPQGHSAVYVLVPLPNTLRSPTWTDELTAAYREKVLRRIEARSGMHDLRKHIVQEHCITPTMWERDYGLFLGATFNLGHSLGQMLYFRPRNRFEEVRRCYLVGGGTHPGSGLPTIYESARISSNLVLSDIAGK